MTKILALDLGTSTGVALGEAGVPPADVICKTWKMPKGGGDDVGPFAAHFMGEFKAELDGVGLVIFERPLLGPRSHRYVVSRFMGMAFVIEGVCSLKRIECVEVNVGTLKKEFAGHGKAEKADMIMSARRRGFKATNEHEADAVACWYHVIGKRFRPMLDRYDPSFRGMFRGADAPK